MLKFAKIYSKYLNGKSRLQSLNNRFRIWSNGIHNKKIEDSVKFGVNSHISGFVVKEVEEIPEIHLTAIRLQHAKTGADYLHIAREDSNNVFCIGFRTTPMDSTGVAHILEHTVLCGSQKYPCRDPFFKMLNRSLSTFMNAMTGSDYTMYPFSTQNPIDYRNLLSIYLDAVFFPKLSQLDFFQEGWRLEHSDLNDMESPITFKGVVFNEMKGVFSDSQNLFMQKVQNNLLPSHTYGHVSGGDPLHIPSLTWEELKNFHTTHYHPSNCRIYSYGNIPLEDHLSFIDSEYLSKFEQISPNTDVPLELKWSKPRRGHLTCNPDPMTPSNCQSSIAISFMLSDIRNDYENFILAFICELLVNGPNAPFYKSLIETSLGTGFSPVTGFSNDKRNTTFSIGLQGVNSDKLSQIEVAIEDTFNLVIKEGFPEARVQSLLHNIELSLKHQSANFGLALAMNLIPVFNHDSDVVGALRINKKIQKLRNELEENPTYLKDKIKYYFTDNNHKFLLTMSPVEEYKNKLVEDELGILSKKTANLSLADRRKVWEVGQILKLKQEKQEDASCLPSLKVSDISKNIILPNTSHLLLKNKIPLQVCLQPTNGVTYFNAVLSIKELSNDILPLLPLFCGIMTSMGAGDLNFRDFSQSAELVSNGLESNILINAHPQKESQFERSIHLSSYCLHRNLSLMLELWLKVLNDIKLEDISRFISLVKMITTDKANGLIHSGHAYAMSYSSSCINYISSLKEITGGISQIMYLKELSEQRDFSNVLHQLQDMSRHILDHIDIRLSLNVSSEDSDSAVSQMENFVSNIKASSSDHSPFSSIPNFCEQSLQTHHQFPFPVNYAAKSFRSVPYSHPDSGPLRVLARLMFQFLHREIREKGGAYGGGAISSPGEPFSFFSYRDPRSSETLETFNRAIDWVLAENFESKDIDEAKLGVFQKVDSPISPGSRGMRNFLYHVTDQMFIDHRLSILNANHDDIIRVCKTYLKDSSCTGTCLIGPENDQLEKNTWQLISHAV